MRIGLQHLRDDLFEFLRVSRGDRRVKRGNHFPVQSVHVLGLEWRLQTSHLVEHDAERPNIRFEIVRTIFPDLWAGIIRRPCLRVKKAFSRLDNFGNIEVGEFALAFAADQNVRALYIAVHYVEVVEGLEAAQALDERRPQLVLGEARAPLGVGLNFMKNVSFLAVLHDQAQSLT